jgi:pimeloyl-ACP methyl ester carboxylesterase
MIWLAPLVWLMNWMSYLNGSLHRQTDREAFAGHETRGQLDFVSRFQVKAWPGVVARGMLGMFKYDASRTLGSIGVPTLVVAGDQDVTTKPEASEHIALEVPGATLATLSPARHMGLIERHPQFAELVEQFVDAHSPKAPAVASS